MSRTFHLATGSPVFSLLVQACSSPWRGNPCFDITSLTRCRQNVSNEKQMTFGGHLWRPRRQRCRCLRSLITKPDHHFWDSIDAKTPFSFLKICQIAWHSPFKQNRFISLKLREKSVRRKFAKRTKWPRWRFQGEIGTIKMHVNVRKKFYFTTNCDWQYNFSNLPSLKAPAVYNQTNEDCSPSRKLKKNKKTKKKTDKIHLYLKGNSHGYFLYFCHKFAKFVSKDLAHA